MVDFLEIRNRHLLVFNQYQQRKRKMFLPVQRAQVKLEGIKNLTMAVGRTVRRGSSLLPAEMIGRRVNIII